MGRLTDRVLQWHRLVTLGALAVLVLLAWGWLASGAGMAMAPGFSFRPAEPGPAMAGMTMASPAAQSIVVFAMWLVMMVAMMLPSAAPTVLLYSRAAAAGSPDDAPAPPTGAFLLGYLLIWAVFSAGAAGLQVVLQAWGVVAAETMGLASTKLAGAVMIAAGIYQLSPLKGACLSHCRNPAEFLARRYRPGTVGALRMGLIHGAYCTGCCWALMLLLFVGGIMNLAWVAGLTVLVAAEKLLPWGRSIALLGGALLVAAGTAAILAA